MEAAPTSPEQAKRKKPKGKGTGYRAFLTIRALMIGRHAAVDAGETRYIWFRPTPNKLKTRVSTTAPEASGFSYWRCDPNGDVTFVRGFDEASPRAWDVPTPPLSRHLANKLRDRGLNAEPTTNEQWIAVFSAFTVLDAARINGWTEDAKQRVVEARATAKMLLTPGVAA